MNSKIDRLRDFLGSRHECLSGHEAARVNVLPTTRLTDDLHGAHLIADVLSDRRISSEDVSMVLSLQPTPGVDPQGDLYAVVSRALDHHQLDALVQALDQAFDLEIEPQAHMTP